MIQYQHIQNTLAIVDEAVKGFNLHRPFPFEPKSMDHFLAYCQSMAAIYVNDHPNHTHTGALPRGMFIPFVDGHYEIVILPGQNYCWKRFVLCKELFHVLIDVEDKQKIFTNNNVDIHIEQYMDKSSLPITPQNVQAETLAEIAAMEFLFPYAHRQQQLTTDSETLAHQYKIPKAMIEKYILPYYMAGLNPEMIKSVINNPNGNPN
jgi:hypothetical protein